MPAPTIFDEDTYAWTHGAAIPAPTGGTPDVEARAAIVLIIAVLKSAGLIAQD